MTIDNFNQKLVKDLIGNWVFVKADKVSDTIVYSYTNGDTQSQLTITITTPGNADSIQPIYKVKAFQEIWYYEDETRSELEDWNEFENIYDYARISVAPNKPAYTVEHIVSILLVQASKNLGLISLMDVTSYTTRLKRIFGHLKESTSKIDNNKIMKLTKSELKEMIREAIREELSKNKRYSRKKLKEEALRFEDPSEVPEQAYVILTDDGPFAKDVFLSWDPDDHYYTTVDYVEDIGMFDCHDSVAKAEDRAKDAASGTLGGWPDPMHIIKITNFKDAYFNGEEPEYTIVKTLNF